MNNLIYSILFILLTSLCLYIWTRYTILLNEYIKALNAIKEYKKSQTTLTEMVEELINSNIELIHRLKEKETNPEAIKTMTDTIIKLQHVNEVFIDKWLDR